MTRKIATVSEAIRYDKTGPCREVALYGEQTHYRTIPLDSPQWFAWLDAPENNGFAYALLNHAKGYINGFMTVRKERRQRGGAYWTAYRRQGRRLRKIYLGPSSALTEARLAEVAARLYADADPLEKPASAFDAPAG